MVATNTVDVMIHKDRLWHFNLKFLADFHILINIMCKACYCQYRVHERLKAAYLIVTIVFTNIGVNGFCHFFYRIIHVLFHVISYIREIHCTSMARQMISNSKNYRNHLSKWKCCFLPCLFHVKDLKLLKAKLFLHNHFVVAHAHSIILNTLNLPWLSWIHYTVTVNEEDVYTRFPHKSQNIAYFFSQLEELIFLGCIKSENYRH